MEKYNFYQEEQMMVWRRTNFSITAETEEAERDVVKNIIGADIGDLSTEQLNELGIEVGFIETNLDTLTPRSVKENGGKPTMEI